MLHNYTDYWSRMKKDAAGNCSTNGQDISEVTYLHKTQGYVAMLPTLIAQVYNYSG